MLKVLILLLCSLGTAWLVYQFGFGMLIAAAALAFAALLFLGGTARQLQAPEGRPLTSYHTTQRAGF